MAEAKSKKQPPKIADITKPGKSAPSSSARPIIITHRPMLQDPMMVQDAGADEEMTSSQPAARVSRSITLQPLRGDDKEAVVPGAPAVGAGVGTGKTIAILAEEAAKRKSEDEAPDEPEDTKELAAESESVDVKRDETVPEESSEDEADKPIEEETEVKVDEETSEKTEEKPAEDTADKPTEKSDEKSDERADDKSAEKSAEEPDLPLGEDAAPASTSDEPGDTNLSESAQREVLAAKKLAEEQEKIIMSGKYYLPIDAVAHRRTKRHILVGLILILLLAVALFLAGWDANFFSIPGYTAPTNYL